jgi:hypothetical protein
MAKGTATKKEAVSQKLENETKEAHTITKKHNIAFRKGMPNCNVRTPPGVSFNLLQFGATEGLASCMSHGDCCNPFLGITRYGDTLYSLSIFTGGACSTRGKIKNVQKILVGSLKRRGQL